MSRIPRVCWDSAVLITILRGRDPDRKEEELTALHEAVSAFDGGQLVVVVPSIIHTEVLAPMYSEEVAVRFQRLLGRSNFVEQDITPEVAKLSGRIRVAVKDGGLRLKTPDAQFVATALVHKCDALHTFDDGLLRLSGTGAVDGLTIIKPQVEQTELQL